MEFLHNLVENVTTGWIGAVLVLMGVAGFVLTLLTQMGSVVSSIVRWKCWGWIWQAIVNRNVKAVLRHRRWRAKRIVSAYFKRGDRMRIPRGAYEGSLQSDAGAPSIQRLAGLALVGPRWFNDFYVSQALETLCGNRVIVKAREYDWKGWRPPVLEYCFWLDTPTERTVDEFENNSLCRAYQRLHECPVGLRFEVQEVRETVSISKRETRTYLPLKEAVPACERCWAKEELAWEVRTLVDGITEWDLMDEATRQITGDNREFQEAVISVCLESDVKPDVETVKRILSQAIEIRRGQVEALNSCHQREWTEQLTADFKSALCTRIGELNIPGS